MEARGERLRGEEVEVLLKFGYEFRIVTTLVVSAINAESTDRVSLTFRVDFAETKIEKVGTERFFRERLLTQQLKEHTFAVSALLD